MIDSRELRIGNWVMPTFNGISEPKPLKVTGMFIRQVDALENHTADNYTPIELTPEMLEKCGFVMKDVALYQSDNNDLYHNYTIGEFTVWFDNVKLFHQSMREGVKVTSLHQLQNLFYALTGTELEINL